MLAMLAFGDPQDIGYDPTFTFSPVIPQSLLATQKLKEPNLGTIQVDSLEYTIIHQIFFSCLIHGRGTSCWHVRYQGKDYVIKDSWVHDSRATREESILRPIQGMVGVPELVSAWTVKIGGTDDKTDIRRFPLPYSGEVRIHRQLLMKLVTIPISEFESVRELLSIFIDILDGTSEWLSCSFANLTMHTVHQRLVVEFNILHRDISVNNIMMYDSVKEDNKAKASCGAKLPHNDNETPPPG